MTQREMRGFLGAFLAVGRLASMWCRMSATWTPIYLIYIVSNLIKFLFLVDDLISTVPEHANKH